MKKNIVIHSLFLTLISLILSFPYISYMVHNTNTGQGIGGEMVKLFLVLFISCLFGFFWSKKIGLAGLGKISDLKINAKRIFVYGAFIGFLVYVFGDRYFLKVAPQFYPTQVKYAFFIPFYAALVEEIFTRFGTMTLLAKIFKTIQGANILAGVIFAIGHVNIFQVAGIIYRLNYLTFSSFILNLGISLFFGYIYWKKGLITAMGIHFVANLRYVLIALLI